MLPISQAAYISDKNVGKKFFSKLFESINSTKVEIEGVQFKSDNSAPEQLYIDRYKLVSVNPSRNARACSYINWLMFVGIGISIDTSSLLSAEL